MKYFNLIILLAFISCGKEQTILLPKSNVSLVKEVEDLSPVYIFFETNDKDTLADVNRKNTIISTNWVFNIDKRLPLRIAIPEIMKLQDKKRKDSAHKNEAAQNYYTYTDSVAKNLAFLPFTEVYYKLEKPKFGVRLFFDKNNRVWVNDITVEKEKLQEYLAHLPSDKPNKFQLCFDREMTFDTYIQNRIYLKSIDKVNITNEEFIF